MFLQLTGSYWLCLHYILTLSKNINAFDQNLLTAHVKTRKPAVPSFSLANRSENWLQYKKRGGQISPRKSSISGSFGLFLAPFSPWSFGSTSTHNSHSYLGCDKQAQIGAHYRTTSTTLSSCQSFASDFPSTGDFLHYHPGRACRRNPRALYIPACPGCLSFAPGK